MESLSTWIELIRSRPGMYVGSVAPQGVLVVVFEAIDNAIDQFLAGHATQLGVSVIGNRVTVTDDGAGFPFDVIDENGQSLGTRYLTTYHNSNTADNHSPHVHCFAVGCGLCSLNALTERLTVSSWRDGQLWRQEFSRGAPAYEATTIPIDESGRGTTLEFTIDSQIFPKSEPDIAKLGDQLKTAAYLFPGLSVRFQDATHCFPRGVGDLIQERIADLKHDLPVDDPWRERSHFYMQLKCKDFDIQAAAYGDASGKTEWLAFANGARTFEEGTHQMAFQQALVRRVGWRPAIATVCVTMHQPHFAGPARSRLDVPTLKNAFVDALTPELKQYCKQHGIGKAIGDR
jgi:DNA gyrase subunit B